MKAEEKTILLVEDEAIIRMDQAATLRQYGYHVITAGNGEDALLKFQNGHAIDLILMDINLGRGMDGTQAAEIILHNHNLPLIFLSSHTEMEIVKKTDKISSYGYVVKNSGENVLFTAIKMAFRLFQACQENATNVQSIKDSELRYRRLFESAQDGIFILNADTGNIIDVNPYLMDLIGYQYDELIGKNLWDVSLFHDIAENKIKFLELQKKGYVHYEHLPLLHKNGKPRSVEFVSNVYWVNKSRIIQCNIRDIEKRKQLEDAREFLLSGKTALLQELQHRITNSLSIIIALIQMESNHLPDPLMQEVLANIRNRVMSISHIYALLNTSHHAGEIRLDQYIENMLRLLVSGYLSEDKKIDLQLHLDKLRIDMDTALSVGLILNELVTNSLKHAFPDDRNGLIGTTLKRKDNNVIIEVMDDGAGIPSGFNPDDSKGIGMSLVHMLSKQIKGSLEKMSQDTGTRFRLQFPFAKSLI